jgi:hypothetical protein
MNSNIFNYLLYFSGGFLIIALVLIVFAYLDIRKIAKMNVKSKYTDVVQTNAFLLASLAFLFTLFAIVLTYIYTRIF